MSFNDIEEKQHTGKTVAVYERVDNLKDMISENMQHIPYAD